MHIRFGITITDYPEKKKHLVTITYSYENHHLSASSIHECMTEAVEYAARKTASYIREIAEAQ